MAQVNPMGTGPSVSDDHRRLLEVARHAAQRAGTAILEVYCEKFDVRRKADASPVTLADEVAEKIILAALADAAPEIPVIAEEQAEAHGLPSVAPPRFWLVDPLDGTKEFVNRNGEFTVNIALIEANRPVLGVVHVPVQQVTYAAAGPGTATRQRDDGTPEPIGARPAPAEGPIVLHSRSHKDEIRLDAYCAQLANARRNVSGSSVKFCLLAAGEGDYYPRFGPTMEWDTAAGQAVLEASGGSVTTLDGAPLRYGKPGFLNPDFIARGRAR
jgi:3'(2'), 5'-bisphosphate nucleotidase